MNNPIDQCKYCQKSELSLLLLRPSPIATHSDLQAPGSSHARADQALVTPFIPAGLTESRPVLRLLRAGYVHLYIPKDDQWFVYSVTDRGEVLAQDHPSFGNPQMKSCRRDGHNAAGFRLIRIPQAHELMGQSIWLAFSANLWSDQLKTRNKANPQAMVEVKLGSVAAPAFKPDVASLKSQLLECHVTSWRLPKVDDSVGPMFPFTTMAYAGQVEQMVETLAAAAARHPKTKGKELAVVLPDLVGYAAELNALRLARFELSRLELSKPENAHPLASLTMLDGLRKSVVDEQEARSFEAVSPVMSSGAFQDIMRVRPNPRGWPPGTRWEAMTDRQDLVRHGPGMGRVVFPDQEARRQAWASDATRRNWERYRKYVDEGRLQTWKDGFDNKMLAAHGEPQKRFEADWWKARQHVKFAQYFAQHFDDQAPNRPGTAQDHSAGTAYATEVRLAMTPQPLVRGATFDSYLAELHKTPTDATAHMQRALAGNQSEVLAALQAYTQDSRPDKLHDLAGGLLKGADAETVLGRHHIKYGWMLHAAYGVNTLAVSQSLAAAVAAALTPLVGKAAAAGTATAVVAGLATVGGKGPAGNALVKKLESLLMGTQTLLLARESAIKQTKLEVPVQVSVRMDGAEYRRHAIARQAAGGDVPSVRDANRMSGRNGGALLVTLTTTNLELQKVGFDPKAAMAAGLGSVSLGPGAAAVLRPQVIQLSEAALAQLLQRQASLWEKAAVTLREMAQGVKGGGLSLDGHIGLVALLLNGVSVWNSAQDTFNSGGDLGKWFAFADASAGTFGGLAQVTHSALSSAIAHRAGEAAVRRSLWVMGAGVAASGAGAFGGMATAAGQFVKAWRAEDPEAQALYGFSGLAFALQGTTNLIQFGGAFSEFMIARGSQRAIFLTGAQLAKGAEGFLVRRGLLGIAGMGLTGWGLVFLAGGLIFEVGVVLLTPDALQKHVQNSYFGKGGNPKDKYKNVAEEEKAIYDMTHPLNTPPPHDDAGNMETDPMMVAP